LVVLASAVVLDLDPAPFQLLVELLDVRLAQLELLGQVT
jgi:hypothetical protein